MNERTKKNSEENRKKGEPKPENTPPWIIFNSKLVHAIYKEPIPDSK